MVAVMAWEWSPYLVDGGTRADAMTGLDGGFNNSLAAMFAGAPPEIQSQLRIMSAYRSPERQQQLWDDALVKYGSPAAARKWVAPPGNSKHNHGQAVDLRYLGDEAKAWAHANAAQYGLYFPMAHEPWHIEPVGSRDGHAHAGNARASGNALASGNGNANDKAAGQNALAPQPQQQQIPQLQGLDPRDFMTANALAAPLQFATGRNYLTGA